MGKWSKWINVLIFCFCNFLVNFKFDESDGKEVCIKIILGEFFKILLIVICCCFWCYEKLWIWICYFWDVIAVNCNILRGGNI